MGDILFVRQPRKNVAHRKIQSKTYNFLERPTSRIEIAYHVLVFCLVFVCIALSVFSTIKEHEEAAGEILYNLEIIIVFWFGIEFVVRLWAAGCRSRYQGVVGRLRFVKCPFCIIDIVTIFASIIVLSGFGGQVYAASALRGLRFFQILRLVRMDRRGGTWKLLGSVVYAHRQELLTTLYIAFLILVFSSFIMYLAEKDVNKDFESFAHALWWGVITLCTVGYGDITPKTWQGKMIASFSAIAGISFFALPAGILGSGFALKVQQQQRQKHMIRRRVPAATLIQCLWRCYAVSDGHSSFATWRIHMTPPKSPPPFKNNTSFVHRLSIRRTRHSLKSPVLDHLRSKLRLETETCLEEGRQKRKNSEPFVHRFSDDEDECTSAVPFLLTHKHKGAIRAIRKLKYLVAKRKFKEALKPYDIKDVIESYSAGHSDLVTKVKSVQNRLDVILGKDGSKSKDVYDSKMSLASRIVNVERQVDNIDEKLQSFLEMYIEDRKKIIHLASSNHSLNSENQVQGEDPDINLSPGSSSVLVSSSTICSTVGRETSTEKLEKVETEEKTEKTEKTERTENIIHPLHTCWNLNNAMLSHNEIV
jgi:potassium voltage-gated channel KQT-like subfamily protein 5